MCDGETINTGDPYAIAHSSASAFAEAVAHASIDCSITGTGSASAQAHAKAEKKAEAWLSAWAHAVSSAAVCGKCHTHAEASVHVLEKVLLKAVAEVYIEDHATNYDPYTCALVLLLLLCHFDAERQCFLGVLTT